MPVTIGSGRPLAKKPDTVIAATPVDHVQRAHQRGCRAGDLAMFFHGEHGGRRDDEAEEAVADEQR